jgi:hypothetical protein
VRPGRRSLRRRTTTEPSQLPPPERGNQGLNGEDLFPARYAEPVPIPLGELELAAHEAVLEYAITCYGKDSTLALSIYGKRVASSLVVACATLARHLDALSGSSVRRSNGVVPETVAKGLRGDRPLSASF